MPFYLFWLSKLYFLSLNVLIPQQQQQQQTKKKPKNKHTSKTPTNSLRKAFYLKGIICCLRGKISYKQLKTIDYLVDSIKYIL